MARYKSYCGGASGNSYKVALYLSCAGLDWQPVGVDFAGGQMRDAGWRAEGHGMGGIPALEGDGPRPSAPGPSLAWEGATTREVSTAKAQTHGNLRWELFCKS